MTFLTPELLDTKTYGFERLRYLFQSMPIQEGAIDSTDLVVTQRAAGGAAMFVDIAAGRGFVQADTGARNGVYHVVNDAVYTLAVPAAHATLPRVDQIVVEARDTSDMGSAADDALPRVIQGTATAGTTLDNAYDGSHGAAALPNNCIRLADVLVPAASTSVVNANIRDRRPRARGSHFVQTCSATGTPATLTSVTGAVVRVECTGKPLKVGFTGLVSHSAAPPQLTTIAPYVDNVGTSGAGVVWNHTSSTVNTPEVQTGQGVITPTAGTHLIDLKINANASTGTIAANARFEVEEILNGTS